MGKKVKWPLPWPINLRNVRLSFGFVNKNKKKARKKSMEYDRFFFFLILIFLFNIFRTSQSQNVHIVPCGNSRGKLVKKIQNKNGGAISPSTKKPIMLSHLPARPPVDIDFSNLTYSVSEGRKRGTFKTFKSTRTGNFQFLSWKN